MGDMADAYTDDGIANLAAHQSGQCDGPCEYCDQEEQAARKTEPSKADVRHRRKVKRKART